MTDCTIPPAMAQLLHQIEQACTPELLAPAWRARATGEHASFGHCYVAAEALYHLAGGRAAGLCACVGRDGADTHWWLVDAQGTILDPTAAQYRQAGLEPPYRAGRRTGFLTRQPSRRAQVVMARVRAVTGANPNQGAAL